MENDETKTIRHIIRGDVSHSVSRFHTGDLSESGSFTLVVSHTMTLCPESTIC